MKKRAVFVSAEFEVGGYTDPVEYAKSMLEQAKGYIATQCRASQNEYRGQVWSFVQELVAAAQVGRWVPGTRKNVQRIIDRNKAEAERVKSSRVQKEAKCQE